MRTIGGIVRFGDKPEMHFGTRNNKFLEEKVQFENEEYKIFLDGVLLNGSLLKEQYACTQNCEVVMELYKEYGAEIVFELKGSYALSLWDKKQNKLLVTNDLLSKRSLFYHITEDKVYYSGSFYELLDLLAKTEHTPSLDYTAIEDMMEQGSFRGNSTYLENVFYLNAFESLIIDLNKKKAQIIQHEMKDMHVPESEEQAVEAFDALFTKAICLQYQKNQEYNYRQITTLSGGMDSRACLLKGLECGYGKDLVCFNFAQSGSLDFQISQQIANDQHLDYLFYPMDSALFLNRLNDAMRCNECQQPATGSTAANTIANLLNKNVFGIVNGGLCGGELLGDLVREKKSESEEEEKDPSKLVKAFKLLRSEKVNVQHLFLDKDALFDQVRACQNFVFMFLDDYETFSPFLDEDVFMFATQIKPQYLYQRKFYTKWMMKYIPNSYVVTHTCCPIGSSKLRILATKAYYAFRQKLTGNSAKEMNPFNYWFKNREEFGAAFTEDYKRLCELFANKKSTEALVNLAQDKWDEKSWRKNSFLLTALHAVEEICHRFSI